MPSASLRYLPSDLHPAIPDNYHPHSFVTRGTGLGLETKHGGMMRLQHFAVPQIHVDAARQTRIETPHRTHDINSLELVRTVLLKDRGVLHRVLVWTRSAVDIAWIGIPWGRRIRVVVCDLAFFDHYMVREHATNRFVEAATDGFLGHLELRPSFGMSGVQFRQRLFHEVESSAGGINLEVGSRPIAFDSVATLRDLPLELDLRQRGGLGQVHLYAATGGLDISNINQASQRRRPKASDRTASGIHRQMIACALVEPPRRHHPGVLASEVALLRPRNRCLVPGMVPVHRISERI